MLVFGRAVVEYVREPDPLRRDVALVFSAVAALFVIEVITRTVGPPHPALSTVALLLLLGQPYLTLRVAAYVRPISVRVQQAALIAYLGTALPILPALLSGRSIAPALALLAVAVFVSTEVVGGLYLATAGLERAGSTRFRFLTAAGATLLFAFALFAASAGMAGTQAAQIGNLVGRLAALLAGIGYVAAFLPPRWLRRQWQAGASFGYTRLLLETAPVATTGQLWDRYAQLARSFSGSDAAVVLLVTGEAVEVHAAGLVSEVAAFDASDVQAVIDAANGRQRPVAESSAPVGRLAGLVSSLASRGGIALATVTRLPGRDDTLGALVLLAGRRTLFAADDVELLSSLASQTGLFAERAALLADQRRLTDELSATVEALRNASQAKSDFLASMSHELRTPLNAVIGFSELMRGEPAEGTTLKVPAEWVEHVNSSGQHLLGLINDVLDITKVEAGRLDLHLESVDVAVGVSELVGGLRPLAERKAITIRTEIDRGSLPVDRGRLRQILYNLLSNAIKFTPEGGSISIAGVAEARTWRLSVADTGVGIAPGDLGHVFEEFRQVGDLAQRQEGSGLGLALTRRLVEAHGGTITAVSEPGRGSTFEVTLPSTAGIVEAGEAARTIGAVSLAPIERAPVVMPAAATRPAATGAMPAEASVSATPDADGRRNGGRSILVVEDEPSAVRLLRTYLQSEAITVRVASDGESGIVEARRSPPDAIVLDILLPGIDGWEVLRQLKSDATLRDIPVIIVTVVDEREVGLALGAVDYFVKPVDRKALLDRLERLTFTSTVRQRPVRVLAVDDDPASLSMVEAALRPEGFTVVGTVDGQDALRLAREEPPDLVICDLLMPDLDGFGVVAALKRDAPTRDVPILILTAHELSPADKTRLNGKILGVVHKGEAAARGLREWLAGVGTVAPLAVDGAPSVDAGGLLGPSAMRATEALDGAG